MWSDFRFAIRSLKQRPGYTIVAVLALGLGVGANTAIFSLAEGLVYRPLALPDLDRVVTVEGGVQGHFEELGVTPADLVEIGDHATSFERVTAYAWWTTSVSTGNGFPEQVQAYRVTPFFFQTLGVEGALGRVFNEADQRAGSDAVVVISDGFWERKFARNPSILGTTIRLGGEPFTIVGIAPRFARVPSDAQIWTPIAINERFRSNTSDAEYRVLGRLKPGVSMASAAGEMHGFAKRIASARPAAHAGRDLTVSLLRDRISGNLTSEYTKLSQVAAILLLLVAASNVANLLFAIVSGRVREIALRQALGASRWAIVRQLLAESLILGAVSVPVAIVLALWGLDLNKRGMPAEIEVYLPGWRTIGIDSHALLFGIGVALLGALAAGILPAWLGSKTDLNTHLREASRSLVGSGRGNLARTGLVVVQVTLSMVLISGAALMQRGAAALLGAAPGQAPGEVLAGEVDLPQAGYPTLQKRAQFAEEMIEKVRAAGGVESAVLVQEIPFHGNANTVDMETDSTGGLAAEQLPKVGLQVASPGYFAMLGIPNVRGRDLSESDALESQAVAVVSELAAREYFGGDAIGKRLRLEPNGTWVTVVGVCGDILQHWILRRPMPTVYRPYRQMGSAKIGVLIRSRSVPATELAPGIRAAVMQLDRELPLYHVMGYDRMIRNEMTGLQYIVAMLGVSGGLSLLLSAVGVYSLMSFTVAERRREMGIRLALGARPGEIVRLVVGRGLGMVLAGLVVGTVASLGVSKMFAGLIYGVPSFDPASIGLGIAVLGLCAFVATYIPARWAANVDPMDTLRHD